MAAQITDKLRKVYQSFSTTLASQKAAAASTMSLSSASGIPTTTAVDFTVGRVDSGGTRTPSAKAVYKGTLSGTTVSNLTLIEGTDQLHAAGTVVEITWTASTWNDAVDALLTSLDQDGTLKAGAVDVAAVIADAIITKAKLTTTLQDEINKGWINGSGTWTYVSATTFTVPAADAALMSAGTKLWLTQTTSKYFYVASVSGTTVTVANTSDYTLANAAITAPYFSNAQTPVGFPTWFNYTPTWTTNGTQPSIGNGTLSGAFSMSGKNVQVRTSLTAGSTTTFGTGNFSFSLPATAAAYSSEHPVGVAVFTDQGIQSYGGLATLPTTTTFLTRPNTTLGGTNPVYIQVSSAAASTIPFAWGNTDQLYASLSYQAA